jgi:hypothetical protein
MAVNGRPKAAVSAYDAPITGKLRRGVTNASLYVMGSPNPDCDEQHSLGVHIRPDRLVGQLEKMSFPRLYVI